MKRKGEKIRKIRNVFTKIYRYNLPKISKVLTNIYLSHHFNAQNILERRKRLTDRKTDMHTCIQTDTYTFM